jgi:RNA polymerase sigma-70 factor (ECF subfamily)
VRERRSIPFSALASGETQEHVQVDSFLQDDRWSGHWAVAPEPWPEEQVESEETLAAAAAAIDELAPAQREVVRLRDVEGWDAAEVCEALGLSPGNQRVLLHRGRARVQAALEAHHAGVAPALAGAAG